MLNQSITDALLEWYDIHQRDLPWRTIRTPYRTLVSEVMLQQTRVDTVIPYFEAFLESFPTVEALAKAEQNDVMAKWSGLGYYSRARNLHKAAGQIVARGSFPNTLSDIRALAGVGEYIAGAIGSMAFGLDVAAVDGNLHRVLSRLFCDGGDRKAMWSLADTLLPKGTGRCGDFNQALMDLGSSYCTKKATCEGCPLQGHCQAYQEGRVQEFPVMPKKKQPREAQYWSMLVTTPAEDRFWMGQRPDNGLYGGMVEPWLIEKPQSVDATVVAFIEQIQQHDGAPDFSTAEIGYLGAFIHVLTHIRMTVHVVKVTIPSEEIARFTPDASALSLSYGSSEWLTPTQLQEVGLSTLTDKVMAQLTEGQLSLF